MNTMQNLIRRLLDAQDPNRPSAGGKSDYTWLTTASDDDLAEFCDTLCAQVADSGRMSDSLLVEVIRIVIDRQRQARRPVAAPLRNAILALYQQLGSGNSARWILLQWLAVSAGREDLIALVERILVDPPANAREIALVLAPLFQTDRWDAAAVFPRLLDAIANPRLAAPVLDLANFITRRGFVDQHPATGRVMELARLLGALVQRLAKFEESPAGTPDEYRQRGQQVDEAVAVVITLCDALALLGDQRAIGKLYQTLSLKHRRLRAEAASALARLGDEEGRRTLVQLVAEPVVRLRVLADAADLGIADRIDPKYTTQQARAEAEVALALAQPSCFGMPPQQVEHVETRKLSWPGYEQPVSCHLIRYRYELDGGSYTNIAICGPVTHALIADLNDLPPDDIFAVYAGWHAEHEEIEEVVPTDWSPEQQTVAQRFTQQLYRSGYTDVEPVMLAAMFGHSALVTRAMRDGRNGVAVVDAEQIEFQPTRPTRHPLGPQEIYWRYKGRRILRLFNR